MAAIGDKQQVDPTISWTSLSSVRFYNLHLISVSAATTSHLRAWRSKMFLSPLFGISIFERAGLL